MFRSCVARFLICYNNDMLDEQMEALGDATVEADVSGDMDAAALRAALNDVFDHPSNELTNYRTRQLFIKLLFERCKLLHALHQHVIEARRIGTFTRYSYNHQVRLCLCDCVCIYVYCELRHFHVHALACHTTQAMRASYFQTMFRLVMEESVRLASGKMQASAHSVLSVFSYGGTEVGPTF